MEVDVRDAGAFPLRLDWPEECRRRECRVMARQVDDKITSTVSIWCWHAPKDYPAGTWRDSMNWERDFTIPQIEVMIAAWVDAVHVGGRYHKLTGGKR